MITLLKHAHSQVNTNGQGNQKLTSWTQSRIPLHFYKLGLKKEASDDVASEALKFLIHFVGDMHQPLHLTGRDRGGNSISVLFDRRHTSKSIHDCCPAPLI
jgi:hypothetical protein